MSEHDKPRNDAPDKAADKTPDKTKPASLLDDHDPAISALYRDSAQEMPPPLLDAKITQAAHAAVSEQETAPVPPKSSRQWQWLGGLAASVVVVLLAVELLPQALRSPLPTTASVPAPASTQPSKERPAPEDARVETQAARAPASADGEAMPDLPAAPLARGMLQENTAPQISPAQRMLAQPPAEMRDEMRDAMQDRAEDTFKKTEAAPAAPTEPDHAETTLSGLAGATSDTLVMETPESPDAEFERIAALWKHDNPQEAIERFAAFRKRYPDYTPDVEHLEFFKALQAELDAREKAKTGGQSE